MIDIQALKLERLDEELEISDRLRLVLQRMARNKDYGKKNQNLAQEALDVTRTRHQQLLNQRAETQAIISTRRNSATSTILEVDEGEI